MHCRSACAILLAAPLLTGCAEQIHLTTRAASGSSNFSFWPPPDPTSIWVTDARDPSSTLSFGQAAERIASALDERGYREARWYPVGVHYVHGFAVTTRLEGIDADATPKPASERWSPRFEGASELIWLESVRDVRLPAPGRYRVFLVAFTDLPFEQSHRATRWNEDTVMSGPDLSAAAFPARRIASLQYRFGVYVYEYASDAADGVGEFVASSEERPTENASPPLQFQATRLAP